MCQGQMTSDDRTQVSAQEMPLFVDAYVRTYLIQYHYCEVGHVGASGIHGIHGIHGYGDVIGIIAVLNSVLHIVLDHPTTSLFPSRAHESSRVNEGLDVIWSSRDCNRRDSTT